MDIAINSFILMIPIDAIFTMMVLKPTMQIGIVLTEKERMKNETPFSEEPDFCTQNVAEDVNERGKSFTMYYDLNPNKRLGETTTNIYKNLIKWIDTHPGCVVNDIRIHLELAIKDKEKREEKEREKYKNNGQTKKY